MSLPWHLSIIYARGWAANSRNMRVRLQAELEQARSEIEKLKEELRIKDTRMASLDPQERLAGLECSPSTLYRIRVGSSIAPDTTRGAGAEGLILGIARPDREGRPRFWRDSSDH